MTWQNFCSWPPGPPPRRRYYAITEAGRVRLAENRALWRAYCEGVDWLLREEAKDGEA